ncbi:MAG: hypothetical protein ACKO0V_04210 [bacterium]
MESPVMLDYVSSRIETNKLDFNELESRESTLASIMREQVKAVLNREAMRNFEQSYKFWRKNPEFGVCVMVSTHVGINFICDTWRGLYEDLHSGPYGPSLERMIDIVMVEGHDARIQFAGLNAKYLMCRYICMQHDREAALESWMKYSRLTRDANATARNGFYLRLTLEKEQARSDLAKLALSMSNKWTQMLNDSNQKFKELVEKVALASEHFSFGNSSVANLHRQVRQQLGKVHSESSKLEMSQIRMNSLLNESEYKPADFLDMKRPLAKLPPLQLTSLGMELNESGELVPVVQPEPAAKADTPPDLNAVTPPTESSLKVAASVSPVIENPVQMTVVSAEEKPRQDTTEKAIEEELKKYREELKQILKQQQGSKQSKREAPQFFQDLQKASDEKWDRREAARIKREQEQSEKQSAYRPPDLRKPAPEAVSRSTTTPAQSVSIAKVQANAIDENVRRPEKGHVGPPGHHTAAPVAAFETKSQAQATKVETADHRPGAVPAQSRQVTESTKPAPPFQ